MDDGWLTRAQHVNAILRPRHRRMHNASEQPAAHPTHLPQAHLPPSALQGGSQGWLQSAQPDPPGQVPHVLPLVTLGQRHSRDVRLQTPRQSSAHSGSGTNRTSRPDRSIDQCTIECAHQSFTRPMDTVGLAQKAELDPRGHISDEVAGLWNAEKYRSATSPEVNSSAWNVYPSWWSAASAAFVSFHHSGMSLHCTMSDSSPLNLRNVGRWNGMSRGVGWDGTGRDGGGMGWALTDGHNTQGSEGHYLHRAHTARTAQRVGTNHGEKVIPWFCQDSEAEMTVAGTLSPFDRIVGDSDARRKPCERHG